MRVLTTIADFRRAHAEVRGSLGFVPTMGYLHEGHLELVRRAKAENEAVAASIFVNPTQFGPAEDLAAYPRDFARDRAMLERTGCDLLFYPSVEEIYPPPGADMFVVPGRVAAVLEGAVRPGHFRGVATVVAKLFNIVQPQRAYFGQKDGQQVAVIKRMVRDLDFPVEIVVVPTVREPDGLAMSSRNVYLSPADRAAAPVLYRALRRAEELYQGGERDAEALRRAVRQVLASEPLAHVDYVSVADADTLEELNRVQGCAMASLAVRIGRTRLIDNAILGPS
ncbi:MAG: pantoate--beta-alanine ligase [Chloroflexi bacterium]|nr:pantoate--beta-alanine ligase [Chloroflexota bacterium]